MPSEFFGQYLLENGLISRNDFLDAIRRQAAISFPLCAFAISKGYIDAGQLRRLDQSVTEGGVRALEDTVRDRFLNSAQLEELRRLPIQRGLYLAEALIRGGVMSPTAFARAFADYARKCPGGAATTSPIPSEARVPHRDTVEAVAESFINVFVHYVKQVVRVSSLAERLEGGAATGCVVAQELTGDGDVQVALAFPKPLACVIVSGMFGEPVEELDPAALDALCEFLNVISGGACAALGERGMAMRVKGPPAQITADSMGRQPAGRLVVLNLETTSASLQCAISFEGGGPS